MKLHLGRGRNKLKDYLNCDISSDVSLDEIYKNILGVTNE